MNKYHHLILGLLLTFLVWVIGYLAWAGIFSANEPVDETEARSMIQQSEQNTQRMNDTLAERLADQPATEQQVRLDSPTGQALSRHCIEWTDFYDNHPTDDAQRNRDKACGEYRSYVESGKLPDQ